MDHHIFTFFFCVKGLISNGLSEAACVENHPVVFLSEPVDKVNMFSKSSFHLCKLLAILVLEQLLFLIRLCRIVTVW